MKKEEKTNIKWYDNAKNITTLIIVAILMTVICSQAFAVTGDNSLTVFSSVINLNASYFFILIYFILIKTYIGKKYFNYLNVFLITIYFILSVTSFLTIVQSFSFNTILSFLINIIILVYLFHTMFRDTRVWKEFKLGNSPFNEIPNDYYYSAILIIVTFSLIINLISTVVVSGLVISILEAIYISLLARYIYLYREYLDYNKKDINNSGNFDSIKETINDVKDDIKEKTTDFIEKHDIDDKIDYAKDKIKETADNIKEKTTDFIEEHDIDDKIDDAKEKIKETADNIKDKAVDLIDKDDKKKTSKKTTKKDTKKSTKKTDSKKKGDK